MYILEILATLLFIVLIVLGYKKNNSNIMLVASSCFLVSVFGSDFIVSFIEGYNEQGT